MPLGGFPRSAELAPDWCTCACTAYIVDCAAKKKIGVLMGKAPPLQENVGAWRVAAYQLFGQVLQIGLPGW
jgi:hypothetical protein